MDERFPQPPCHKPVKAVGFFVGFYFFCCTELLLLMHHAQRLQKAGHRARIPWCGRSQAQSSCFSTSSLRRYRRRALQAGLCQTFAACLQFSSFNVFTSQCALSAIKYQTPVPQFPLHITLPLWGSRGSQLGYSWHRHLIQGYLNFILWELLSFFTWSVFTSICALNCASGSRKWWWGC